jgi:hypothetical protein
MANEPGVSLEDMSLEELKARLDRLIRAGMSNSPEARQHQEDEITATVEAINRKKGTKNTEMMIEEERERVGY